MLDDKILIYRKIIGRGVTSHVYSGVNLEANEQVAIKKVKVNFKDYD